MKKIKISEETLRSIVSGCVKKVLKEVVEKEDQYFANKPQNQENTVSHVGNGYTYEILYNFNQAKKYYEPTHPGSWSITYGREHFNFYMQKGNLHYIVFLKDGYENIPRPETPGEGFTPQKPHDEYGNSMIAFSQKNDSWEPVFITSRWGHGFGNIRCEGDHAYTTEEFMRITGVTKEDLENIYWLWRENKGKLGNDETQKNLAKNKFLRKLKYAQMKINGERENKGIATGQPSATNENAIERIVAESVRKVLKDGKYLK